MAVTVLSAAKRLAEKSDWTLSNLELQKITYLAHMFFLGRTNGLPLVLGEFEAWDYGPVHPDLYYRVKAFGAAPVQNVFHGIDNMNAGKERDIVDEAWIHLGRLGPGRLVNATHRKGGAWYKHYAPGIRHCVIPNADILEEYRGLNGGA